ncbi:MAG TPA: MSMEG_4193 family putative phosphomutase [candidate division Zixibacteria bacterium]|nr:MSMEG_4193 family putative phosphomutase [candidate division Zixibacteria bacterium]
MSQILLVRHGQNEWVSKNRLAGWTPAVHLNDQGKNEVILLAERLAHLPIRAIYSSPLERCLETADPIAESHGLETIELEAVGEVRYGKWEGKKIKKLAKKRSWYAVQHYPSRFQFPGGETMRQVQQRAVNAIENLCKRHSEEMIVIVSHADVIKLLMAHYLGLHIDLFQRIGISPASISIVAISKSGPVRVLRMNDYGPIKSLEKESKKENSHTDADGVGAESAAHAAAHSAEEEE